MRCSRLLLTILVGFLTLLLVILGQSASAVGPFTPTWTVTIDDIAPSDPFAVPSDDDCPVGSPCKAMFHMTVPDGQPGSDLLPGVGSSGLLPPSFFGVAGDVLVPDGAIIVRVFGSTRHGAIGSCNAGTVGAFDVFSYDATTDPATTTGSPSDVFSFDHWPTQLNGVRDEMLANNPGAVFHARWMIPIDLVSTVNTLIFQLHDGGLAWVHVRGDPTAPAQFEGCGPIDSTSIVLGMSMDNPDTGPDEGGVPLIACTSAGTQTFQTFLDRNDTPPGDEVTLFDTATCSPNTPPGSGVSVPLLGGTGSTGGMEVTFADVTTEGSTSVTGGTAGPTPPTGFEVVGLSGQSFYYDINTTATFTGPVTVCVSYDDTGLTPAQEDSLKLMQNVSGSFVDRTSSVDTTNNIICGTASSFSVWAVMAPLTGVGGIVELAAGQSDLAAEASGSSARDYAAPIGAAVAAGAIALAAGGWYARRRWLR